MPKLATPKAETVFRNAKAQEKEYSISDGRGLYMVVTPDGSKLWDFRYRFGGRRRKLAIKGGFASVSLKAAREQAEGFRAMLAKGLDPAEVRKAGLEEEARREEREHKERAKGADTFRRVADEWMASMQNNRSESTRLATARRFQNDVYPWIGDRPIADISAVELLEVLQRIVQDGTPEKAHRVLWRCRQIFRYALPDGRVEKDITIGLAERLPSVKGGHHAAITDPKGMGQLLRDIDDYQGWYATKYALRILPLVFTRPGELRLAQWSEIDFDRAQWDIPAGRMKMKLPHSVPLAQQTLTILQELHALSGSGPYLFPTPRQKGKPLSDAALVNGLRRMGYAREEQSAHGFRAIARTMLDERLRVPPAYIEAQLAHKVPDALGRAYNRTQHLDARREMMQTWADYLDKLRAGDMGR